MVRATSKATRPSRRWRVRRLSVVAEAPALRVSKGARHVTRHAGKMPNRQPVAMDASKANAKTRASIWTSSRRGMLAGAKCTNPFTAKVATHTPSAPPARLSRKVSVSIWRMTRARVAPNATRIAASRMRPGTRIRRRLARLLQTINKTIPTAPRRKINPRRAGPTTSASSGRSAARRSTPSFACLAIWDWTRFNSASVCSGVTPGPRRATAAKSNSPIRSCS